MVCPIKTSRKWQLLVEEQGGNEEKAMAIYVANKYDYPAHIIETAQEAFDTDDFGEVEYDFDPVLRGKEESLSKAIDLIQKKISRLNRLPSQTDDIAKSIGELKELVKDMQEYEVDKAIVMFINAAKRMTNTALLQLNELDTVKGDNQKTIRQLNRIKDFTEAFSLLEDLVAESELLEENGILSEGKIVLSNLAKIKAKRLKLQRIALTSAWAPRVGKIEVMYREKAEKKFMREISKNYKKKAEREEAKKRYINQYMIDNSAKIRTKTQDYLYSLFTTIEDIPQIVAYMVNPKDINNEIMDMLVDLLDKADFTTNHATIDAANIVEEAFKKFQAYVGKKSNMKEQYDSILEKDEEGKLTGYYINPMSIGWDQWLAENKGTPIQAFWSTIMRLQSKNDTLSPNGGRLQFKIPYMNRTSLETALDGGKVKGLLNRLSDLYKIKEEDTEYGDIAAIMAQDEKLLTAEEKRKKDSYLGISRVITNEAGQERKLIPINYRYTPEDTSDQSFDIASIAVLDVQNVYNYSEKNNINAAVSIILDTVANSNATQRTGINKFLKVTSNNINQPAVISGKDSNLYKALESVIEHRMFGVSVSGPAKAAKISNTIKSYTSHVQLAFNYMSAGANFFQGTLMTWMDATGEEGGHYTRLNRARASVKYTADLPFIVQDMGRNTYNSKTNLLLQYFNADSEFEGIASRFVNDNGAKRVLSGSLLHSLQHSTEHAIQSMAMYSTLDNIKVLNHRGNYIQIDKNAANKNKDGKWIRIEIDKKGKETEIRVPHEENAVTITEVERSKGMTLDEAFTVVKGKLVMDQHVAATEKTQDTELDSMYIISRKLRRVSRDLFGNYDSHNKSQFERTIVGNMTQHMRGWMIPGIQKRWGGIHTVLRGWRRVQNVDELEPHQLDYNQETGQLEEGHYVTSIRFFRTLKGELNALTLFGITEHWSTLSNREKINIRKTIKEAAIILLLLLTFKSLDDDDDNVLWAFYARRVYSEFFTYLNPQEGLRTLRSPAVSLNLLEDVVELFIQMTDPTERYKTGRRRGESKLKKNFYDLIPILKQGNKNIEDSLEFLKK